MLKAMYWVIFTMLAVSEVALIWMFFTRGRVVRVVDAPSILPNDDDCWRRVSQEFKRRCAIRRIELTFSALPFGGEMAIDELRKALLEKYGDIWLTRDACDEAIAQMMQNGCLSRGDDGKLLWSRC